MGMYTQLRIGLRLRQDLPAGLPEFLTGAVAFDRPIERLPFDGEPHEFFGEEKRWPLLFCGSSAYFVTGGSRFVPWDGKSYTHPELFIDSSFKNYGDEVALFLDWIAPFSEHWGHELLGFSRYEEATHPTLIYSAEPGKPFTLLSPSDEYEVHVDV